MIQEDRHQLKKFSLTEVEKREIDKLLVTNYGKKIRYDWHMLYQSYTGIFYENYFLKYFFQVS